MAGHLAYDAALENFQAAQKVLPQSLNLGLAEAIVLNLAGRRQEGYAKLREIEERWPDQDSPYVLAGTSAYFAGRVEDARQEFEMAAALRSDNPLVYYYLALMESEASEPDLHAALQWADMAVEKDPSFAWSHLQRGKIYERLGKPADAREALEEAVRLQPEMTEGFYLLSRVYRGLGETALADAAAQKSEVLRCQASEFSPEREMTLRLLVQARPRTASSPLSH